MFNQTEPMRLPNIEVSTHIPTVKYNGPFLILDSWAEILRHTPYQEEWTSVSSTPNIENENTTINEKKSVITELVERNIDF
jgi:hypothetical protein